MKVLLGVVIIACVVGIGFIDIGGAVLFAIVGGYFGAWIYLIDHSRAFKEFFYQLGLFGKFDGSDYYRWSLVGSILLYFGMVAAGFYLPDDPDFKHWQFGLIVGAIGLIYFLIVFLPPIIRTRRALRHKA